MPPFLVFQRVLLIAMSSFSVFFPFWRPYFPVLRRFLVVLEVRHILLVVCPRFHFSAVLLCLVDVTGSREDI